VKKADRLIVVLHAVLIATLLVMCGLGLANILPVSVLLIAPLAVNIAVSLLVLRFWSRPGIVTYSFLTWLTLGAVYIGGVNLLVHAGDETGLARAIYVLPLPLGLVLINIAAVFLWRRCLNQKSVAP
jgi:hypothetical protein